MLYKSGSRFMTLCVVCVVCVEKLDPTDSQPSEISCCELLDKSLVMVTA